MAENQSKEVDSIKELEDEYNSFVEEYDRSLAKLSENIGTLKGIWPVGEKRTASEVFDQAYAYTEAAFDWLRYLLEEIKTVRTRTYRREIELLDAIQKTTKALRAIQTWMDKYDPIMRRLEEDYQAALGRVTGGQGQQGSHQN